MLRILCRGLAALAALALLLLGLPAALAVGTLVVARRPGLQQSGGLVDLFTKPDNGNLFLWALIVVGWVAWLCFAGSVLVEVPAQLRGRSARRVFALGWSQRMTGGLIAAVLALLPTAGAALAASPTAATNTAGPHAPLVATAPVQPTHRPAATGSGRSAQQSSAQPQYRVRDVRPAESLWSIAEKELGSGARWKEIARLNQGRIMDAEGSRFDADRPIQPGWTLLLPADAASAAGVAHAAPPTGAAQHVVVRPGDTLSAIAEQDMGSATKWPELFAANQGVRAPDGVRLENPDVIEPGMVLTVPHSGSGSVPPVARPPVGTPPVTAPPVAKPPVGSAPPSAPPSTPPSATPPASTPPASARPSASGQSQGVPPQGTGTVPTAAPTAAPTGGSAPTGVPATPPQAKAGSSSSSDLTEEAALGGTALLAAVVLGAAAMRRAGRRRGPVHSAQVRRPRPRTGPAGAEPPALPAALLDPLAPEPAEEAFEAEPYPVPLSVPARFDTAEPAFLAALTARQDSTGLDLLDRALRSLARTASTEGRRLPALTVARITPAHTVELHLSTPAPPIAPFQAAHASTVWWCHPDSDELLPAEQAAAVTAPYPALVSLGTAAEGSIVLVDLEAVRLLHLSGAPKAVMEVLRTLALELAFTPLADEVTIHTVGVAEELEQAAEGRLRVHDSLEDAVAAVSARDHEVRTALAEAGAATPREARSRGAHGAAWAPEIVLCATVPDGTMPEELGRMLDASPRGSVAVVASAPPPGAGPMARWTLPATGSAALPGLGMSVELQHLSDHQYLQWLGLLGTELPAIDPADVELIAPDDGEPLDPVELDHAAVPHGLGSVPRHDPYLYPARDLDPFAAPAPYPAAESGSRPEPRPAPVPDPRPYARQDLPPALDPWAVRSPWPDPAPVAEPEEDPAEIVEAAHELTLRRLRAGDHQGAEAAAFAGLGPVPDAELLHRDLLCVYADAGATDQLNKAVHRLERIAARSGRPLESETDELIAELRGSGGAEGPHG